LTDVLGVEPTPLDEGLRRLVDDLPEQLPEEGAGALERKRFWAVVDDGRLSAPELMRAFRAEARELLPLEFGENGEGEQPLEPGMTLTLELPIRGEVQVRVEEADDERVTLATLEGHPLAGIIRFVARPEGTRIRFLIEIFARSANLLDRLMMKSGGAALQRSTWQEAVERVVERTGGVALGGVQEEATKLEGAQADEVEAWVAAMVEARKRNENARSTGRSVHRGSPRAVEPPEPAA
jgi:NADH dehydrogenase